MDYDTIATCFSSLLVLAEEEHGAPNFAAELAMGGAQPDHLRQKASEWLDFDFDPPSFAAEIAEFANDVEACLQEIG